ncbi:EAL domain-containing protein [Kineococcus sp. LSe6-4]|uniref:EAL domain-containing protein n=1 Tax=Kineococcus halophytocola TaxID=3234027 RepID=A0ABV4GVU1_9ACTN
MTSLISPAAPPAADPAALALQAELPAAIADGQLRVHYQRIVAAGTHRVVGVEALVRWQHPEHGLLGPGAFVPLAEGTPTMVALTTWVLERAAAQCAAWRAAGHDVGVSVNLSAALVHDPGLLGTVRAVLAEHRLDPGVLTLEVTETALLADPCGAAAVLAGLRAAGARVSLDDFGTGYTSLTMLRQLEVDELKIDRTFVAAAAQAPVDAAIVRALVDLAHRLSMEVVAEGVEDARTAELVRGLGADVLQGFHFARPVPAPEVFTAADAAPVDFPRPHPGARLAGPTPAPRPADEAERVQLARRVLAAATGSQGLLRRTTALAAGLAGAEFASFNVVGEDHVHLLGAHGHSFTRVARDGSPCAWTVLQRDVLEVDCAEDHRTARGDVATAGVRHYLGVPVLDALGRVLGVLCVYDRLPLTVDAARREQLRLLAGVLADHVEGVEAAGQLDRVHAILQATTEVDRADGESGVVDVLARAVHDLTRPDFTVLVGRAAGEARWTVLTGYGDAPRAVDGAGYDEHGRSAVARALATQRPVWVPDTRTSSVVDTDLARRWGAAAVLAVPVVAADGARYVLSQCWRRPQPDLPAVLRDAAFAAASFAAHAVTARSLRATADSAPAALPGPRSA